MGKFQSFLKSNDQLPTILKIVMRYLLIVTILLMAACDSRQLSQALGTLERDRIAHTATANEIIVALPVKEGSEVNRGMLLVQLDDTLQKAQVDKARAEVALAEANLEKLRNGARAEEVAAARARVTGAQAEMIEAKVSLDRFKTLIKQNLAAKAELDRAKAIFESRESSLEEAQESLLVLTNGTREEDLRAGDANLQAAKASLDNETRRLEDLTVLATRDGILDSLPWNLGERVTQGSPVAIVMAGKAPYARVYIPEPSRAAMQVGDELLVHVDGIEQSIQGRLRWIASEPAFTPYYGLNQDDRSRLMYLAEIQLPDEYQKLPSGLPVQVDLP